MTSVRKAYASKGDDVTISRFVKEPKPNKQRQLTIPSLGHPTVEAGRSLFYRKGVKPPRLGLLVSGHSNVKIGRDVRKGHLKGYWIYTLSLEERATCPRSCSHWYDCYGNNMPFAKRTDHRDHDALCAAIEADVAALISIRGRRGILVRLHALGDFYSVDYVWFWIRLLAKYPTLAIYGYTARQPSSTIGQIIGVGKHAYPDRFRIRWSDGSDATDCTVSVNSTENCPPNAFVCPEQTGRASHCATCAACWQGTKNVAFIDH